MATTADVNSMPSCDRIRRWMMSQRRETGAGKRNCDLRLREFEQAAVERKEPAPWRRQPSARSRSGPGRRPPDRRTAPAPDRAGVEMRPIWSTAAGRKRRSRRRAAPTMAPTRYRGSRSRRSLTRTRFRAEQTRMYRLAPIMAANRADRVPVTLAERSAPGSSRRRPGRRGTPAPRRCRRRPSARDP